MITFGSMAIRANASGLEDLCKSCGLCCTGVLVDFVPVEEADVTRLGAMGFNVDRGKDGAPKFDQPCPMFRNGCCSIYSDRPRPCSDFKCELLKRVESGAVGLAEAKERVAVATSLVDRIWPLLKERAAGAAGRQWVNLLKAWTSKPPSERATGTDARLLLELTALNRLLDSHFREEGRRHVRDD